jgi:hypothetical protein
MSSRDSRHFLHQVEKGSDEALAVADLKHNKHSAGYKRLVLCITEEHGLTRRIFSRLQRTLRTTKM